MKRLLSLVMISSLLVLSLAGCGQSYDLYVFNWGQYIDKSIIKEFEEETGYKVLYDEFEENEDMYAKIKSGAAIYDVICPSDYMVEQMIQEGLLQKLNYDNIPNAKNIGAQYFEQAKAYDPGNEYSIPNYWGTVGIIYNKNMVNEPIDSWSAIFDEKYKGNILMINSIRDGLGVALKYLGYSLNSQNEKEIKEATDLLKKQKALVQGYFVDQIRDKMIGNEAAIAVNYSGEAKMMIDENPDLAYVVPKEGSNIWSDNWVITSNAVNVEAAEAWINFLCRPDIALKNFEEIGYSTPNEAAHALIEDEETRNNEIYFPGEEITKRCESFSYLGVEGNKIYQKAWTEVKAY